MAKRIISTQTRNVLHTQVIKLNFSRQINKLEMKQTWRFVEVKFVISLPNGAPRASLSHNHISLKVWTGGAARPHPILTRAETSKGMIRSDVVLCKKNVRLIVTIFLRKHFFLGKIVSCKLRFVKSHVSLFFNLGSRIIIFVFSLILYEEEKLELVDDSLFNSLYQWSLYVVCLGCTICSLGDVVV